MTEIPAIALDAFRRRRERALAAIRAGTIGEAEAEAHLRPWAAIALSAGADPAAIHAELPELVATRLTMPGGSRSLLADDLCPRRSWAPILAAARDKAVAAAEAKPTPERVANARALIALAQALAFDPNGHHVPPLAAAQVEQAA